MSWERATHKPDYLTFKNYKMIPAKNIDRFSIVHYDGNDWMIETKSKPITLIRVNKDGRKEGREIDKDKLLQVVFYPAQLALYYLEFVNK